MWSTARRRRRPRGESEQSHAIGHCAMAPAVAVGRSVVDGHLSLGVIPPPGGVAASTTDRLARRAPPVLRLPNATRASATSAISAPARAGDLDQALLPGTVAA